MSTYLEQGKTLFEKKEYSKAIEYFQAAIQNNSSCSEAYLLLSDCYYIVGNIRWAQSTLYSLLAHDPNDKCAKEKLKTYQSEFTSSQEETNENEQYDEAHKKDAYYNDKEIEKLEKSIEDILLHSQQTLDMISQLLEDDLDDDSDEGKKHFSKSQLRKKRKQTKRITSNDYYGFNMAVSRQDKIARDIKKAKRAIPFLRLNVLKHKKNKRKILVLKDIISKKEKAVQKIKLEDFFIGGDAIISKIIKGRIAIYSRDQESQPFRLSFFCKKDMIVFQKYIDHSETFSIRTEKWQIVFFYSVMLFENEKEYLVVPYDLFSVSCKCIYNYRVERSQGYKVVNQTWYHARVDGGPDRRYSQNWPLYNICRYQVKVLVKNNTKSALYFIFDNENDANTFKTIFNSTPRKGNASSHMVDGSEIAKWFSYIAINR